MCMCGKSKYKKIAAVSLLKQWRQTSLWCFNVSVNNIGICFEVSVKVLLTNKTKVNQCAAEVFSENE